MSFCSILAVVATIRRAGELWLYCLCAGGVSGRPGGVLMFAV